MTIGHVYNNIPIYYPYWCSKCVSVHHSDGMQMSLAGGACDKNGHISFAHNTHTHRQTFSGFAVINQWKFMNLYICVWPPSQRQPIHHHSRFFEWSLLISRRHPFLLMCANLFSRVCKIQWGNCTCAHNWRTVIRWNENTSEFSFWIAHQVLKMTYGNCVFAVRHLRLPTANYRPHMNKHTYIITINNSCAFDNLFAFHQIHGILINVVSPLSSCIGEHIIS